MGEIVLYQLVFPLQKSINSPPHKKALYILFTSGSTGKPKGVIGSRQGTWKRLEWMWQTFPLDLSREMAFRSTRFSFVDSIWEIAGPLFKGIPLLHIRSRSPRTVKSIILQDLSLFFQVLSNYRVTRLTLIPSVLDIVLTAYTSLKKQKKNKSQKLWLEYVLVSGEVFSYALVLKATHVWKQVTFVNLYGSTEVCGDITWYPIKSPIQLAQQIQWQKYGVPIGRKGQCIGDSMYRLLVDQEEEEKGEIQVSGSAVTLGYVEEHTIKFVQRKKNVKWFSTGDVGRFIDDELFFCGRKDQRIKIYGQWVDFILIERLVQEALDLHTDHEWSPQQFHVLFVVQSPSNDQELIAFIKNSCSQALQLNESQIRTFLAKTMPLHGLPLIKIHLKVLEKKNSKQIEVPLLSNGKLDRQAFIQSITKEKINGNHFSSALEKVLRKVLDLKGLFFKDLDLASQTFEQLGGNSLLASLVVWELQQQLQPLYDPLRPEHLVSS
jgi:acyl-CoA synthetase (AMP-forming)/AMP-acid ligase II